MKSVYPPPPPDIKGRNKTGLQKRQRIIQSLAVGGLAVTAWQKPIINSVLLPAHAQTTGTTGQAGQSGQVGQTEQGQANQEQTAVPQQNQQEQQQSPGIPNHSRLEELPAGDRILVIIRNADQCKTIQIVSYELVDRWNGPGQVDKDYWIKITGIQTPISGDRQEPNREGSVEFRIVKPCFRGHIPVRYIHRDRNGH